MSIFEELYEEAQKNDYFLFQKLASSFARSIASALKYKKLTQKDLAEKLSVSEANVSKIMRGDKNVTLLTIAKIANTLDCEVQDITMCDNMFIYSNTETLKKNTVTWKADESWMNVLVGSNFSHQPTFIITNSKQQRG